MPTLPDSLAGLDRYLLITADSHAGPTPQGYGPYLEKKYQSDYQDWLTWSVENAKIMKQVMGSRSIGVDGDPDVVGYRNWDSKRRLAETESDGVAAEVIFSNTSPPFAPTMHSEFGEAEAGDGWNDCSTVWARLIEPSVGHKAQLLVQGVAGFDMATIAGAVAAAVGVPLLFKPPTPWTPPLTATIICT